MWFADQRSDETTYSFPATSEGQMSVTLRKRYEKTTTYDKHKTIENTC